MLGQKANKYISQKMSDCSFKQQFLGSAGLPAIGQIVKCELTVSMRASASLWNSPPAKPNPSLILLLFIFPPSSSSLHVDRLEDGATGFHGALKRLTYQNRDTQTFNPTVGDWCEVVTTSAVRFPGTAITTYTWAYGKLEGHLQDLLCVCVCGG